MIDPNNDPSVETEEDRIMVNDPSVRNSTKGSSPVDEFPPDHGERFCMSGLPACKWGKNEIRRYKIYRVPTEATAFFGIPGEKFRQTQWYRPEYEDILHYQTPEDLVSANAGQDKVRELLLLLKSIQMRDSSIPIPGNKDDYSGQEAWTDQAVKIMLQMLGMECQGQTFVRNQNRIKLQQHGNISAVTIDTAVVDERHTLYLLLLTEHKVWDVNSTPFAQLMAGAIAAFQFNNKIRAQLDKPILESMIFPGIIWLGSVPSFYRIKITQELADAVKFGRRPAHETHIAELRPPIEKRWRGYGLWRLRNRPIIMKILENMKDFLPTNIDHIPDGWRRFMSTGSEPSGDSSDDDTIMDTAGFEDVYSQREQTEF